MLILAAIMDIKNTLELIANLSKTITVLLPALGLLVNQLQISRLFQRPDTEATAERLELELETFNAGGERSVRPYILLFRRLFLVISLGVQASLFSQLGSIFREHVHVMRVLLYFSFAFWALAGFFALSAFAYTFKFQGAYTEKVEARLRRMGKEADGVKARLDKLFGKNS